tara:strand:+ start:2575 stop:4530 length:1956 start_codon:yes stop_codon:yes gene_type:complete
MTNIRNALMQAAGTAASGDPVYVEDVFATHLRVGTGSTTSNIDVGIDLSDKGGLVWTKDRNWGNGQHVLSDTVRGINDKGLNSASDAAETSVEHLNSVSSTGYALKAGFYTNHYSGYEFVDWVFAKQKGFFDVVTYTGNGSGDQTISHNLGSTPGFIAVKATNAASSWRVFHTGTGNTKFGYLNSNSDISAMADLNWNATSTTFVADSQISLNTNGRTYVAYLWASGTDSASQIFGEDGDEAIIKCGSYTADSSNAYAVNLGFEPQWLMIKRSSGTGDWEILDNMRGVTYQPADGQFLEANNSNAEFNDYGAYITSTGFVGSNQSGANGASYVYIAIRRGPMKEPSAGTDVFQSQTYTGDGSTRVFDLNITPDWVINTPRNISGDARASNARITGSGQEIYTNGDQGIYSAGSAGMQFDYNKQIEVQSYRDTNTEPYVNWLFQRFPKVFDVVVYEGNGNNSPFRQITHNLGVAPELVIIKNLDTNTHWGVGMNTGNSDVDGRVVYLHLNGAYNGDGLTTSATTVTLEGFGGTSQINTNGEAHIMLMFASLTGISKVGAYVGTGNDLNVTDLGAAARFVLIKRTDASGDWYTYDSTRGIVAGNDPYLFLNDNAVEVTNTDYIDSHSSGFTITSSAPAGLNASGGKYLYLAFA